MLGSNALTTSHNFQETLTEIILRVVTARSAPWTGMYELDIDKPGVDEVAIILADTWRVLAGKHWLRGVQLLQARNSCKRNPIERSSKLAKYIERTAAFDVCGKET